MNPVVLLHGSNSWGEELAPLARALAQHGIEARMPNLLGHGGRPVPDRWTFRDIADDLVAWLDHEKIGRARLVGYSTGGYLGLYLAANHPGRVDNVVAIAAKYVFDAKAIERFAYLTSLERFLEPGHPRVPLYERHHADWRTMAQNNSGMFREWANGAPLSEADLARITCPVMVIDGDRDPLVPFDEARALGRIIPGAHVAMCYGSSHPIEGLPLNGVAQAIVEWMKKGKPPADALLFDLGGVVMGLDWERCFSSWSADSGVPAAQLRARYSFDPPYERHERGEIGDADYYTALGDSLGIDLAHDRWAAGWNAIFTDEITPVVELIERVKSRVPVYAFSNTNAAHHRIWSSRFARAVGHFREVFTSHELGLRKPERAAFEAIARRIGVAPSRILFFDDTRANVDGALAAGLQAVWVKSPQDVADALRPWLDAT